MSNRIPRLEFHELDPKVQNILHARVKRLGYLGEFFKCTGHQPEVLAPFMEMTEALKKALPDRLTEVGALTIAMLKDNRYELHQHERLSRKLGFGNEWVAAVERLDPGSEEALSESEGAVQKLIVAAIRTNGQSVSRELDAVIELIGAEQTIAVLFLIGRYITHAMVVNALGLEPPVPSIFDEGVSA